MRVVFICGSAEPGKDGVGDYTRILACEIIKQGHSAVVIAINDRSCQDTVVESQVSEGISVNLLRIPHTVAWEQKVKDVADFIKDFNPEYISLQYVPFAYHEKGVHIGFDKFLKKIAPPKVEWHIMFHELWVGMDTGSPFKFRLLGFMQKQLIKGLLKTLSPQSISTHSQLYKAELEQLSAHVQLLPLFGNISYIAPENIEKSDSISFVLFGGIHFGADSDGFCKWLQLINVNGKKAHIDFIGSNGEEQQQWVSSAKKYEIPYTIHGRQGITYIADLFNRAHAGITTTPYLLCEKSGSVAAMLEYALPVVCVARSWVPINKKVRSINNLPVTQWRQDIVANDILNKKVKGASPKDISLLFIKNLER